MSKEKRIFAGYCLLMSSVLVGSGFGQATLPKKVFVVTDMEGVSGIFDSDLQCMPGRSRRFEESRNLLTGEINAAVDGLFAGGATEVIVYDGHDGSQTLSVLDINPRCRLLTGSPIPPTMGLDSSYSAVVFIGQHAMAGAKDGILSHSYSSLGIQNMWVNGTPEGEIGTTNMLAGEFGIPVAMLSGDAAACRELHDTAPQAECAEVKSGVGRTAGYMLPHPTACKLIREKAQRAMERLGEMKPYKMSGAVDMKVEITTRGTSRWRTGNGVERLDERTWVFHGKNFLEAWLKYLPE